MIRASGLYGRAVINLDTAERIGQIDELIVDPSGPCVAGYVISGRARLSGRKRSILPVEVVEAMGPDALTIRTTRATVDPTPQLDALPRLSELTGRKMVSFGGRYLGTVQDALVDERNGRIVGYPLERPRAVDWIESLFGFGGRREHPEYVRADAALRIGAQLIVVPDDAIASVSDAEHDAPVEAPLTSPSHHGQAAHAVMVDAHADTATTTDNVHSEWLTTAGDVERRSGGDGRSDDADPENDWDDVDHDGDTGLLAVGGGRRTLRHPQAVKMR